MEKEASHKQPGDCKQANDNKEVTCSVTVDGQDKQEFSFRLYEFDTREHANEQDMEKIVIRSICESLSKTLKLPPFGNRTIKVKLAISPENGRVLNLEKSSVACPAECLENTFQVKPPDSDCSKSANTDSTYLLSSATEKPNSASVHYSLLENSLPIFDDLTQRGKPMSSPKIKPLRHNRLMSLQKQEAKHCAVDHNYAVSDTNQEKWVVPVDEQESRSNSQHQLKKRPILPENQESKNTYVNLTGWEANTTKGDIPENLVNPQVPETNSFCANKIFDGTHECSKSHCFKNLPQTYIGLPPPSREIIVENGCDVQKTQVDGHDDILNLNLDLCDITPGAKFDWEKAPLHQRPKSHEVHEPVLRTVHSPKVKLKHHSSRVAPETFRNNVNMSPSHHLRQREKERVRAMQHVASWINRGHGEAEKLAETNCEDIVKPGKQEHRHLHEHVHHHYHHFVDI